MLDVNQIQKDIRDKEIPCYKYNYNLEDTV